MILQIPSLRPYPGVGKLETPRIQFLEFKCKDTGQQVAWSQIERIENISKDIDGTIDKAELQLYFRVRKPNGDEYTGVFCAGYMRNRFGNPSVSLSSFNNSTGGYIETGGFTGHRLGTYLMSEVVRWVKQWPEANVETIHLRREQATEENKERRNQFYDRLNVRFNFEDDNKFSGQSLPMLVRDLVIADNELWAGQINQLNLFECYLAQRQESKLLKMEKQRFLDRIEDLENKIKRPKTICERILRSIFRINH